jgi:hypothetical protein
MLAEDAPVKNVPVHDGRSRIDPRGGHPPALRQSSMSPDWSTHTDARIRSRKASGVGRRTARPTACQHTRCRSPVWPIAGDSASQPAFPVRYMPSRPASKAR